MKKIDLSGIQPAPKSARSAHPVVEVDDTMEKLLTQFVDVNPRFKQLKNQDETITETARALHPRDLLRPLRRGHA